jgi:hypothetical protein
MPGWQAQKSYATVPPRWHRSLERGARLTDAKEQLVDLLKQNISPARTDRLRLLCKLLPEIGQTDTLIDVSSSLSEFFDEYGFAEEFKTILSEIVKLENLDNEDRFWAADTLVFWAVQTNDLDPFETLTESCQQLRYNVGV